jgi:hypothetical protein
MMAAMLAFVIFRQPEKPPRFETEVSIPLAEALNRQPGWDEGLQVCGIRPRASTGEKVCNRDAVQQQRLLAARSAH